MTKLEIEYEVESVVADMRKHLSGIDASTYDKFLVALHNRFIRVEIPNGEITDYFTNYFDKYSKVLFMVDKLHTYYDGEKQACFSRFCEKYSRFHDFEEKGDKAPLISAISEIIVQEKL